MTVEDSLKIAKESLSEQDYNRLYMHYWLDFYKRYLKEYLDTYKGVGKIKAFVAGASSTFGPDKDIDFEELHSISCAYAEMSLVGYPTGFYECAKEQSNLTL